MRKFLLLAAAAAAVGAVPAMAQAQDAVEQVAAGAPAALKQAAEAIDPLAQAAEAEAAWQAYLMALEASGGAVEEQAHALNRMGDTRYYQQDMQGALAASLEAMKRLEAAGLTDGEAMADTLANSAVFYGATGAPERQLPLQERALAIRVKLYGADPAGLEPDAAKALGLGYLNYSHALYEAGRFAEAADHVGPSITGLVDGGLSDATLFVAFSSGANMLVDAGRLVEALNLAQRGVTMANRLLPEGHPFMGFAQATLAKVLLKAGRYEEAEEPARTALDIMTATLGSDHPNTMVALHNLGVISARLGHYDEAIALMLARQAKLGEVDAGETVNSFLSASNAAHEAGRADQAMDLARQAVAVADTLAMDDRKAIGGYVALADRQEEAGNFAGALATLQIVIDRFAAMDEAVPPATEIQRGLLQIEAGEGKAGWQRVEQAHGRLVAQMVGDAQSFELGADLDIFYEPVMQLAQAAMLSDRADDALRAFELASWGANARAKQYLTLRASFGQDAQSAALVETLEKGSARLRLLNRERAAMLVAQRSDEAEAHRVEIERLQVEVDEARKALAIVRPDFAQALEPQAITVADLQARMTADEALLIAMPSRHQTFSMVITADGVAMGHTDGGRPIVRPLVSRLRDALDGPAALTREFPVDAAKELHDLILPMQVRQALSGKARVAVVTSDALSRIPFAILAGPDDDWLVRHHAFSTALTPSAAFERSSPNATNGRFIGVGAPQLGDGERTDAYRGTALELADIRDLPALPQAEREVALVAEASGAKERVILTGAEASEPRIRAASQRPADVILFATHGLTAGEIGGLREPALVLTPPGSVTQAEDDGFLLASEIAGLGLAADIVILSACNSAAGRDVTAPAYTGLANAFLASGSRSLMLSHWRVRDDAAARLTAATMTGLSGDGDYARALQRAQLDMMAGKDHAHPAFWAPFVIIGD
ncbi:CHAT domain-containing tetratricopeptide repeat protein [Croceicoccus naphthovorans]|uniref:Uncharacterized protein n=1 Tax=Croceicoccus naphthovorans TaxID=1348774 RepID=A0A0G3XJ81_9SPHN|nr:CHAT domain-containing protein [Croceicoccus naphthovorans]AKM10671.1 hypothetical protein AB433_12965 [Croceicoccus naphthovorans]MBB3988907.1 CHAT domain-containing protein [Croceicoccus naphthovorans]